MLRYRDINGWSFFLTLVILEVTLKFGINYLYINDTIFFNTFVEQLSAERITFLFKRSQLWQWLGYAILPLIILSRIFYTSMFLYIGVFFAELKIDFSKLFKIALIADFTYILSGIAKLVILIFFKQVRTLEDLQFTPLSLMDLMNSKTIDPLFIYPLSLLNIFELAYFFILAWLLVAVISESNEEEPVKFGKSLKLVTASYGSGLLLWVLVVMFITLNLN